MFKAAYLDFKQDDLSMRKFIAMDDKMFKEFTKALGDMSDQSRIELITCRQ